MGSQDEPNAGGPYVIWGDTPPSAYGAPFAHICQAQVAREKKIPEKIKPASRGLFLFSVI
jgi:hypothetical protein